MKWIILFLFMGIFIVSFWLLDWYGEISLIDMSTLGNHFSHHFNGGLLPFVRQDDFMAFLCAMILISFLVMGLCVQKIKETKPLKTKDLAKAYFDDLNEYKEFIKNHAKEYGIKKIKGKPRGSEQVFVFPNEQRDLVKELTLRLAIANEKIKELKKKKRK